MFDAFTKVVAQADARGQFISTSEIDALAAMVSDSNKRLDAVNRISSNASSIVASAARQLFAQQPSLISPGGNAYTSRRMAACLRDMEIILRYVTYSAFTGDSSRDGRPLPERPSRGPTWPSALPAHRLQLEST